MTISVSVPGECLGINGLHLTLVITSFYRAAFGDNPDAQAAALSRQRVNRDAQLLMPPLRLMNASSGPGGDLYAKAYRRRRDHFDRVRLSTLAGSAVQRIIAANGSSSSHGHILCNRTALWERSRARWSAVHHATKSKTAVR